MTALLAERTAEVVAAAELLLAKRMGAPVKLVDPVELGGSGRTIVLRVRVADNAYSLPRTLIVKQVSDGALDSLDGFGAEPGIGSIDSAFLHEAVSYQFATALAQVNRPGPDLLAHDLDARLLILSDLVGGTRLTTVLQNSVEPAAGNSLMAFAQALGRLHAATVGREHDFTALMRRAEVAHQTEAITAQATAAISAVPALLKQHVGVTVPVELDEFAKHASRLFGGGRFRAFSPSDLCPDNVIVNDDGIRFLDYEWGGFRDATLDIAYALVSFPGCLCYYDLSRDRAQAMIEAWRAEVVGMWPQLVDNDLLRAKILEAQLVWVWLTTYWFLPDDHTRIAAVREHRLSVPRSDALISRWDTLGTSADEAGRADIAEFAHGVATAIEAQRLTKP
ncbi:phosphotransferase family protein [Antrihabitans cavernicola]|uniref:Phosphotransferase n=1 Tax=Antrihabitans cavernicola TaxID=2495913 RepID=A0A5A7SFP0_9NOCA|nr:phosphotransferase [Spelaeibacter cavernicola]KAA0023497.1 phosphotransferase [Spelaeibacter cavernicola]